MKNWIEKIFGKRKNCTKQAVLLGVTLQSLTRWELGVCAPDMGLTAVGFALGVNFSQEM